MPERPWLTTSQVAQAAGVHVSTISRWGRLGVLPAPQTHFGGRHGTHSRWPPHTPEQARWVQAQLEAGFSWEEIRNLLASGAFSPGS